MGEDEIAVVGMALRFPGAEDPEMFWGNLVAGRESLVEITTEELVAAGVPAREYEDPDYVRLRPLIADPDLFDAELFGLTPREAEILNPQHRLFLEACDAALQRAGVDPARTPDIGVFGGGSPNRYVDNVYLNDLSRYVGDMAIEISNQPDYLATRVSHVLGLGGPSVTVQTACSTALVAVHQARHALQAGECDAALAGGVSIELPYRTGTLWSPHGIHSRDGHCRAFDRDASGTNFGSGVGVVLLKRLADAVRDGDHVHATIIGTLTNNDGAARPGFTSPGRPGQTDLLRRGLLAAGVEPRDLGYIEAHGTGTAVGDPIELTAIAAALAALGHEGPDARRIPVGSVKTNIGHLGPAAGIAGLVKTILSVEHGQLVPSLHLREPHPALELHRHPLRIATQHEPWGLPGPRVATVSSFGIGGTNAVAVVRSAPPRVRPAPPVQRPRVLTFTGVDEERARGVGDALGRHLVAVDPDAFAGAVRTVQGRRAHPVRGAAVVTGPRDVESAVAAADLGTVAADPRAAWLLPGQGAQFVGMAAPLAGDPRTRAVLDTVLDAFESEGVTGLRPLLLGTAEEDAEERLTATDSAQAAAFTTSVALGTALQGVGVEPALLLGHSVGEIAAAHLAGMLDLEHAVHLVAVRGRLMAAAAPGAMLAVHADRELVGALVPDTLDVAAVNGPESFVVAGGTADVGALRRRLELLGVGSSLLRTSHAFHSRAMRPVIDELRRTAASLRMDVPRVPVVSTVTGELLPADRPVDADHWADQLVQPVLYGPAVLRAAELAGVLVEVGAGSTLVDLARTQLPDIVTVAPLVRPRTADARAAAAAAPALPHLLARLWSVGVPVDWDVVHEDRPLREVVPAVVGPRRSYWLDGPPDTDDDAPDESSALPLDRSAWLPTWRREPPGPRGALTGPWLVVHDGRLDAVVEELRRRGERVVVVHPATPSVGPRTGEPAAVDAPTGVDDLVLTGRDWKAWHTLCGTLDAAGVRPATLVYGQHADPATPDAPFLDLLHLVQAAVEHWADAPLAVRAVTFRGVDVGGHDEVDPTGALLHGPVSVVAQETPAFSGGCVDVVDAPRGVLVDALVLELGDPLPAAWVALRGRARFVRRYEPLPVDELAAGEPGLLRDGGVYVVTGGAGALGLHVLRHVLATPGTRVALMSRRGASALGFTDVDLRQRAEGASVPTAVADVFGDEAVAGRVVAIACDVADRASVAEAFAQVRARWGAVTGVFHAAGAAGGELAVLRSDESCRAVLGPKVAGTLGLLDEVGGEAEIVHLFSSVIAVTSDPGMVDYCAANAFLGAVAAGWRDERTRVVTVDWCGWSGSGMVARERSVASDMVQDAALGYVSRPVAHPLVDRRVSEGETFRYVSVVEPDTGGFLDDHRMGDARALSGTTLLETLRAAAAAEAGKPVELADVVFGAALPVDRTVELIVVPVATDGDATTWQVLARPYGVAGAAAHVCAVARTTPATEPVPARLDLAALEQRCTVRGWLPDLDEPGRAVTIGPRWRAVVAVHLGDGEQLTMLHAPAEQTSPHHVLDPVMLDNATALALCIPDVIGPGDGFLPAGYGRVRAWAPVPSRAVAHCVRRSGPEDGAMSFDVVVTDTDGRVVVQVDDFRIALMRAGASGGEGVRAPAVVAHAVSSAASEYLMTPDEGLRMLDVLLRQQVTDHVLLSRRRPEERVSRAASGLGSAPARDVEEDAVAADEGMTPTEAMVARMWRSALGRRTIGLDDDFYEAGGNSLVVVQLIARLRGEIGAAVPGRLVADLPTVRTFAAAVDAHLAALADEPVRHPVPSSL